MQIGPVFINLNYVLDLIDEGFFAVFTEVFTIGAYLLLVWVGVFFAIMYYQEYRENKATADWEWVVLAVDIPPLNVQTPKAIEQMFAHLAGAYDKPNIADAYRGGFKQRWFSFEIISIEGYIQFLVRTEREFQDLVEAAIYAQYPEAEITAVEDYVTDIPDTYPNETHDMWAADFGLAEHEAYPIRSYHDFEHSISKDTVLKDPMGALLESFSRIGSGEQMWLQILVQPIGNSWKEKAIEKIKDLIGEKKEQKTTALQKAIDAPLNTVASFADSIYTVTPEGGDSGGKDEKNQLRYLTPGQTKLVEAMEQKISMIGMKTKIRGMYIARKEVFKPSRGVQALIGAMNQFNSPTANSIVPTDGVGASYFFKESKIKKKKSLYMKAYKKRKMNVGGNTFVLNVEELATIWHFPLSHVKTPQLQKVETKQSEPPIGLPIELLGGGGSLVPDAETIQRNEQLRNTPGTGPKNEDTDTDDFGYSDGMEFG